MPITQARMLTLVVAGDECLGKLCALREGLGVALAAGTPEAGLELVAALLSDPTLAPSPRAIETLVSERVHFRHTEHRNNRNAARLRRQRGTATELDAPFLATPGPELASAANGAEEWDTVD